MNARTSTARLSVLGAAILFSTGGVAIKGTALDAFQVTALRSGIAVVALLLLLPQARRAPELRLLPAALAYAATLILFVFATKLTTAAAAIFLQSTAPLWVLVLSGPLLGERIFRRDLPLVALATFGLVMVFLGSRAAAVSAPQPLLGNGLALGAGFSCALMILALRRLARDGAQPDRSLTAVVLGNTLAFAACLPFAWPLGAFTPTDGVAVSYLGVVQIGLAYVLFTRGLRSLPSLEVSLLVLLEPVLNPLWTWLLLGERPSSLALTGGAFMIASLALRTVFVPAPEIVPQID
jgi:drug/metabolite transporter (DMT)-like permease